jgi:cold shock CspA family protein
MMSGTIQRLDPRGFGFIYGDDGIHYFFHMKEHLAAGVVFNELAGGMRVRFRPTQHAFRGPRAASVMLALPEAA